MGAENDSAANGNLVQFFYKNGALFAQLIHYVAVMDDFLAHVNRRAVKIQSNLDYVDRAHHPPHKTPVDEEE